jgi:hypothetical protein
MEQRKIRTVPAARAHSAGDSTQNNEGQVRDYFAGAELFVANLMSRAAATMSAQP